MKTEAEIRKQIADLEKCRDDMPKDAFCERCGYGIQIRVLKWILGEE